MAYLLWQLLTENAKKYPQKPAVKCGNQTISYQELDDESSKLANLLTQCGIGRGNRVGIFMPKSEKSIVSMLGILKSGAAYVPIDPKAPPRRVAFILNNCTVSGLITINTHFKKINTYLNEFPSLSNIIFADTKQSNLQQNTDIQMYYWNDLNAFQNSIISIPESIESDPAYILYTSGSTGNPKGVILSHRHALTFVDWGVETFSVKSTDLLSNIAPLHFDLSVFDIYVALHTGACVSIAPDDTILFPMKLSQWILDEKISVWYSVPSVLIRLLLHGKLEEFNYEHLRVVLYAGEPFPIKYLRKVMNCMKHSEFNNLYGPTETNVCTYYKIPKEIPNDVTDISIGKACANTEVFAIGKDNQPIQLGQTGELYVKGPSLMHGYWGLPEKTNEVLVDNPMQDSYFEPVYRTGDIVQLEADGNYKYIGRTDHMIKSRGYRIEIGDIEQALYQHDNIKETTIIAIPDDEIGSRIVAFVVPDSQVQLKPDDIQSFCLEHLPRYMIPEEIILKSELPRTSTGKVDRMTLLYNYGSCTK